MDQRIGVQIIQRALRAPISTIAKNAGAEGAVVVGNLIKEGVPVEQGYNAQEDTYVDMFAAGIIDPTKVRCVFTFSSSFGYLLEWFAYFYVWTIYPFHVKLYQVTRTGLVDAASVAGLLTTSEAMICDLPTEGGGPMGPGGGMGGMPGMM